MHTKFIALLLLLLIGSSTLQAQKRRVSTQYGKTLNIGVGIGGYAGYYGYLGRSIPVLHADYEFDVAKNFTLAPFINYYTYRNRFESGNNRYYYRETVIPIGVKGSYYFDDIVSANSNWDFYLAGSLGFAIVNNRWDNDYNGDKNYYRHGNTLFLDAHIGTEYHFTQKLGVFLDLSSGVSTIGLSFHR